MERKPLSRAEQNVFLIIVRRPEGIMLSEIINNFEKCTEKKYGRTTISTFLKRLEDKGYITREMSGRKCIVFPLITKEDYILGEITDLCKRVFEGNIDEMFQFISEKKEQIRFQ